jgi:hypothetical protein
MTSEPELSKNVIASEHLFGAIFDVLDELITRNRAYQEVLKGMVKEADLAAKVKRIEELYTSVSEPRIYTDLRNQAIRAAKDNNPAEFMSLARELTHRTHLWM